MVVDIKYNTMIYHNVNLHFCWNKHHRLFSTCSSAGHHAATLGQCICNA